MMDPCVVNMTEMKSKYSELKGNRGSMIANGPMCSQYDWNEIKVLWMEMKYSDCECK